MEKGIHVICEKPLTLDVAQAKELAQLAKKSKVVNAVNFNVRFHDTCQALQKTTTDPAFGSLWLINGSYQQSFHCLPAPYGWRYDPEISGNMRATSEIGSHWIDLARFLTGLEITAVSATYGAFAPNRNLKDGMMYPADGAEENLLITTEDAVSATLRFSNGALGNLLLSEITPGKTNALQIQLISNANCASWDSQRPYDIQTASTTTQGEYTTCNAFSGGLPSTIESFCKMVYTDILENTRHQQYPTFMDGYINTAVCRPFMKVQPIILFGPMSPLIFQSKEKTLCI